MAKQMKKGRRHAAKGRTKKHTMRSVKPSRKPGKEGAEEADDEEKFTYQKTFNQNDDN